MKRPCVRCTRTRWLRARGLCDPCWKTHHDEYPTRRSGQSPLTCECPVPVLVGVGGVWDSFGALVCDRCQRPRIGPQEAL